MNFFKGKHRKLKKLRRHPTEKTQPTAAAVVAISEPPPTLKKESSLSESDDIYVYSFDIKKLQWSWTKCDV